MLTRELLNATFEYFYFFSWGFFFYSAGYFAYKQLQRNNITTKRAKSICWWKI